jgi:hypothetical protein
MNSYKQVWDHTRYPVWHRRIFATKAAESRQLSAVMRAWRRACQKVAESRKELKERQE